ncbi:MAG: hypothetical protein WAM39_24865, partial [Bryobacteraceae bacterium]
MFVRLPWVLPFVLIARASSQIQDPALAEARTLVESGKLNDAEAAARGYLATNHASADGHFLLGYILFKKQQAKASLAEYTEGAKFRTPSAYDLEVVGGDYVLLHDYA